MCVGTDRFGVALLFTTGDEPQHRIEDEHRSGSNRGAQARRFTSDPQKFIAPPEDQAARWARAEHGRLWPALEDERPEGKCPEPRQQYAEATEVVVSRCCRPVVAGREGVPSKLVAAAGVRVPENPDERGIRLRNAVSDGRRMTEPHFRSIARTLS